jgi:uncharacterized protein (DUF488 family)
MFALYNQAMVSDPASCDPRDAHGRILLLTIGYGNTRSSEELVELLRHYQVRYLVDVRSKPFSKYRPEFSKDALEAIMKAAGLAYLFMGDSLGGMPDDPTCYRGGKVDYSEVRQRPWFTQGIARLETGWKRGHRLSLICSEVEPERCHRSKLIGEALIERGIPLGHIDEDGAILTHQAVMDRLTSGQGALFDLGLTSRKAYQPRDAEEPGTQGAA